MSDIDTSSVAARIAHATSAGAPEFVAGAGPVLVLLHGLGSRWQVFSPVLAALCRSHTVLALDLPGFGTRPVDSRIEPTPAGYADWVAAELFERGIHRPHIIGNSMGGGIALELGRRGVASRVTVYSPVGFWSTAERWWCQSLLTVMRLAAIGLPGPLGRALESKVLRGPLLGSFFGHPTRVDPAEARADLAALASAVSFAAARDAFARYRADDRPRGELDRIPVTVAWGRRDVVLPWATQSRRARTALPYARHVMLGGCGHLPFADNPRLCAALID